MVMASWPVVDEVTPNSWRNIWAPGTHIVGAMFVTRANRDTMMMWAHFFLTAQFCGFSGSCDPSQPTTLASGVSSLSDPMTDVGVERASISAATRLSDSTADIGRASISAAPGLEAILDVPSELFMVWIAGVEAKMKL